MENLSSLPEWARVIGVLLVIIFGVGGGSGFLTKLISRKKIESEANLENANAAVVVATADKTTVETAKDLFAEYKELLSNEKQERKDLENKLKLFTEEMDQFKKDSNAEFRKLQEGFSETKARATSAEKEVKLLRIFLEVVELRWHIVTTEPFPDYNTVVLMEDLK
jgi:hypothetical protein